ncbi:MAG: helix-turn-helix domain-containing protein [Chloroflexota bacterium]|nr:helix-turn-helix domain-containing protein [Chloroflexota bacterium]
MTETKSLRRLRREQLLTIRGLAARAGISDRTVKLAEAGRREPSLRTIRKVAAALGVAPDEVAEFARVIEGETP